MSDALHMHTDLMCASGLELTLNISKPVKGLQHPIMCDCILSIRDVDRHQLPILRMASDCRMHGSVFRQPAVYNRTVFARDRMLLELGSDALMCAVIFADNQRTGRILINAMHDSRAQYTVDPG